MRKLSVRNFFSKENLQNLFNPFYIGIGFLIVVLLSVTMQFLAKRYVVGINVTPSLPDRIFIAKKQFKQIRIGDKIAFSFPRKNDRYYSYGRVFIKIVACKEGDYLTVTKDKKYFCNGNFIGKARDADSKNKKIANFFFNGKIPQGKIFVTTPHPHSYDSKYWGFVDQKDIIAKAIY